MPRSSRSANCLVPGAAETWKGRGEGSRRGVVPVEVVLVLSRWKDADPSVQAPVVDPVDGLGDGDYQSVAATS